MIRPRILAFSGSVRKSSYNSRLLEIAVAGARQAGAEVTVLDLKEFPLTLFDEDLEKEEGTPENATRLKAIFLDHNGLLISAPEYNSSITPLLKNTIDWVSRASVGEAPLAAYRGKVASLMSASPGALGGLRGLVHVRSILGNIGVTVLPEQVSVSRASDAFLPDGHLKDERQQTQVQGLGMGLASVLMRLHA